MTGAWLALLSLPAFRRRLAATAIACAAILAVAAALLGAALLHAGTVDGELAAAGSRLDAARLQQERLAATNPQDPRSWMRYRGLVVGGLFDPGHRAVWAERAAERTRRLAPLAFDVEIAPPRPETLPPAAQRWFDETGDPAALLQVHDLQLRIEGLHEAEVASLLDELLDPRFGVSRLQECALARRADGIGLDTRCVLRFMTVEWPQS